MRTKNVAIATIRFQDGTKEKIKLRSVIERQLPSKEIGLLGGRKGGVHVVVTSGLLAGRKLADNFLTVANDPDDGLKLYTVHLLYPDYMAENYGKDDFMTSVRAKNPMAAFKKAVKEVRGSHKGELKDDADMHILAIYLGAVVDVNPNRYGDDEEG